jgi:hypothetical protein
MAFERILGGVDVVDGVAWQWLWKELWSLRWGVVSV